MLPKPGDLVGGKYRVVRVIGDGGMGTVYEARHEHLGSQVALKFLHPDLGARQPLVARFLQEARVSASIKSPHVTHVIDVDETPDGNAYFVMELLEGESLEHRLERGKPLPVSEAVDIGLQMLAGLEVAHARGIVHRDLKPDNVWLTPGPRGPHVKLLDFGIAKLKTTDEFRQVETRPGSMMGTPAYMAPEQAISADQVDHRADLYSFGVILYEMLSGHRPVDADEPQEILEHLVRGDVHPVATRNPSLPAGLAALVDHLVAPNPDERPASAAVVRNELFAYARESSAGFDLSGRISVPVPGTVPPSDVLPPPFARPNKTELGNASTEVATQKPRTASMPAVVEVPPKRSEAPAPRRRGALGWVLALVGVALAAGGLWAYENQSVFSDDITPPLPTALPPPPPAPLPTVDVVIDDPLVPQGQRRTTSGPARAPGTATPSTAGTEPRQAPTVPFPFQIPSVLPIPSGLIPSALPPFFQNIPGFQEAPKPPAPSATGSAP
jgi:eukaryotic-like serine/threonine-protein kinase